MRGKGRKSRIPVLETVLLCVAASLLVGIVGTTAWAFASGRAHPGSRSHSGDAIPPDLPAEGMFTDLGALRAPTADTDPAVVVVTPVFAYDPADIAFREELTAKKSLIRSTITVWFRRQTKADLAKLGETGVKAAVLGAINGILETGTVTRLFFTEYSVLD